MGLTTFTDKQKAAILELNRRKNELSANQLAVLNELNRRFEADTLRTQPTAPRVPEGEGAMPPTEGGDVRPPSGFFPGTPLAIPGAIEFVSGFAKGAVPFIDEIPGVRKSFDELRSPTQTAGEIAGTLIPAGAAFKGAKVAVKAFKPIVKKLLPFLTKNTRVAKILKGSGIIATESIIADALFEASNFEAPSPKSLAVFAAIDVAVPGIGRILKKIKTKEALTVAERQVLKLAPKEEKLLQKQFVEITPKAKKKGITFEKPTPKEREIAIGKTKIEKFKEIEPIEDTIKQFGPEIRKQRRGKRPISLTVAQAGRQKEFVKKSLAGQVKPGTAVNAEQIEAVGGALNDLSIKIKAKPDLWQKPEIKTAYKNLSKTFFGGATELGRGLRQLREERSILDFQALEFIRDNADDLKLQQQLSKFITKNKVSPTFFDKFIEFQRNMKLWSASSIVRSTVGNMTMQLFKVPETLMSAALNRAGSAMTGLRQDRFSRELAADFVGMKSGLAEGFQAARGILAENDKFLRENLFLKREVGQITRAIKGRKGRIIRFGQNVQGAIDSIFRIPATRGEARRRAMRQSLQEGLEGSQLLQRVDELTEQLLKNPKTFKQIQEVAAGQTFQKELGKWGQAINRFRRTGIEIGEKEILRGAAQLVVPFFNTAINLWKEFVKRTPLGLLRPEFLFGDIPRFMKRKELGVITDPLSKMITGTTFFATTNEIVGNIFEGKIHGRGPDSTNKRNLMFQKGWQPYSIEIDGKFTSYLGFEPISSFLGAMADWNAGKREAGTKRAIEKSFQNIVNTFAENPFLQGITDAADLLRKRKNANQYFAGMAAGSVMPSIVRQTARVLDPALKRKPETLTEAVSNAFLFSKVEDRFNPLGQKAIRRGAIGNLFALRITKDTKDPVVKEYLDVGLSIGPSQSFEGIDLTRKEQNKLNEIAGKELYRAVINLLSNPDYRKLSKSDREKILISKRKDIFKKQKQLVFGLRGEKLTGAKQ